MKAQKSNHLVSLLLNEPVNYDRLLEITTEELQMLKDECDVVMKEIKTDIIKEYEMIKPSLNRMRDWKTQLRKLKDKRDLYKTFLSLDKNQSLLSTSSIRSSESKPVSFTELFRDIDDDKLLEDPPSPPPVSLLKKTVINPAAKTPTKVLSKPLVKPAPKTRLNLLPRK